MASTMSTFILAMLLHPHVYRKAQEEIDRVIGPSRLPDYEDSPSLPYLNAVIKETLRLYPTTMSSILDQAASFDTVKSCCQAGTIFGMLNFH